MANLKDDNKFMDAFTTLKYRNKPTVFVNDVLKEFGIKHEGFRLECKKQNKIIDTFLRNDYTQYINNHINSEMFLVALAAHIIAFERNRHVMILFPYRDLVLSTGVQIKDILNKMLPSDYIEILEATRDLTVLNNGSMLHCASPNESSGNLESYFEPDILFVDQAQLYKNTDDIWRRISSCIHRRFEASKKDKLLHGIIIESDTDVQGFGFEG